MSDRAQAILLGIALEAPTRMMAAKVRRLLEGEERGVQDEVLLALRPRYHLWVPQFNRSLAQLSSTHIINSGSSTPLAVGHLTSVRKALGLSDPVPPPPRSR